MKAVRVSGTEHYADEAPELLKRYESISFADAQAPILQLIPPAPGRALDIGAGTGRDAAGLDVVQSRVTREAGLALPGRMMPP